MPVWALRRNFERPSHMKVTVVTLPICTKMMVVQEVWWYPADSHCKVHHGVKVHIHINKRYRTPLLPTTYYLLPKTYYLIWGGRELECINCLPCSSSPHSSFDALSPVLLFSALILSHFSAVSYNFNIYFLYFQFCFCFSCQMYFCFVYRPGSQFCARFFLRMILLRTWQTERVHELWPWRDF